MSAKEAVSLLTDEAERQNADADDLRGIVRAIVVANVSEGAWFEAWFCVCIELADRAARREGYQGAVDRAMTLARRKVGA